MTELVLRVATPRDADAIWQVFSPSLRLLAFLPQLHTVEEDRAFIADVVLKRCRVSVIESDGNVVSFLARDGEEIQLLHIHPSHLSRGAGTLLVDHAKAAGLASLWLWCFQQNLDARRFYERHGYMAEQFTDGARNDEKLPDVRYRWRC